MTQTLKALIVEDSENDMLLLIHELRRAGFEPTFARVDTPGALEGALNEPWDVVLCDYSMPQFTAKDALAIVRARELDLPFIVASGTVGEEVAVETMRLGAHDYLMKGKLQRLGEAIRRELEAARNRAKQKSAEARVRHLNAILSAIRNINQLIVREKDPSAILRKSCIELVEGRGYETAWIAITDEDCSFGRIVTERGLGDSFDPMRRRLEQGLLPSCCETAAKTGAVCVIHDRCLSCPPDCPMMKVADSGRHRIAMTMAAPIANEGRTYGFLCVTVPQGLEIDDEETGLVWEVAGDIAFALKSIETENERRQEEEKFRLSFDNASIGMALIAPDGRLLRTNKAVCDLLGYTRGELEGKSFVDITYPDDLAESWVFVRSLLSGKETRYRMEKRYRHKDGQPIWADVSTILMRHPDGSPQHFITHILDISERKRAEEALRKSEAQLSDALAMARAGHWEYDVGRDIFTFNDNFYRIFRTTAAEVGGYEMSSADYGRRFCHPDDAAVIANEIRAAIASADPSYSHQTEHRILDADGAVGYIAVRFLIVKDAEGRTVKTYGVNQDVTERRQAEEGRLKLEAQLRVSQKMEAIGSLAGGVAHDFNNLLSVILSYTAFAMEGMRKDDPLKADLLEVRKAADRAAALTRQLLAFSRKQVLQPVVLSLNQVAVGVEKMLRRILGEDIDLVQALAPDLGPVLADPGQIEQVLMNLVVNARDAMPEGGKLTIETANIDIDEAYAARHVAVSPGAYVRMSVTDTGYGMDEQTRARLFEPFFTTKEKGKGTGLGLSMVYGIVHQSGGAISVYSEPGRGTTFKVYLPRALDATVTAKRPSVMPRRSTGTETILAVEDEAALREIARRTLAAAGYTVLVARDGDEALEICGRHSGEIQLLLTDVVMPRMNGRTLAQALSGIRPKIKVIFMSGYNDDAIVHHGVLDAGTHFLGKPFTGADLLLKVREVLDGSIAPPDEANEVAVDTGAEMKENNLEKEALPALPRDMLEKLREAVIAARYQEIVALVETIRITHPETATGLLRMADRFDYDGMRDLLGQWMAGSGAFGTR